MSLAASELAPSIDLTPFELIFAKRVAPLKPMTVSECADEHRQLPLRAAEPGKFYTDRVPYLRGIQDILADPDVDLVAVQKCVQAAISEALRSGLHYWVRRDPGDTLWVFPDQNSVRKNFEKHLEPLVNLSLTDHLRGTREDVTKEAIRFKRMDLNAGWSGSPQTLSGDAYRYVVMDEVDKYPPFSGRESDPIALGEARSRTFTYRAKTIIISSPTTSDGAIAKVCKAVADKRYFWVPCLDCGARQIMEWGQVKYPDRPEEADRYDFAERVHEEQLATYECIHCHHPHTDAERHEMVEGGEWLDKNGNQPKGRRRVAFFISSLYSPWSNLSKLAEKWIKAQGDLGRMMQFWNQELGLPFEQQVSKVDGDTFIQKAKEGHPRHVIPAWAGMVIASADTQKHGFWWVVRAWGRGGRSRLIDHGFSDTEDHLYDMTLGRHFPVEGCDETGETMSTRWLFIDSGGGIRLEGGSGTTTKMVYEFSLTDSRIIACKGWGGHNSPAREITVKQHMYKPQDQSETPFEVLLATIDTHYFKDLLDGRIGNSESELWEVHEEVDADYAKQMSSEHKVFKKVGAKGIQVWQKRGEGVANHYFDCEVYNAAAAEYADVNFLPSQADLERIREDERRARIELDRRRNQEQTTGLTDPHGRPFFATDR